MDTNNINCFFSHIGLIVKDRDQTAKFLLKIPGAKITATREVVVEESQMIVDNPLKIRLHFVNINGTDYEVIEPFDCPDSYLMKHLSAYGEGFHHLAYECATPQDHKNMLKSLESEGYEIVLGFTTPTLLVHYVAMKSDAHTVIELKSQRS